MRFNGCVARPTAVASHLPRCTVHRGFGLEVEALTDFFACGGGEHRHSCGWEEALETMREGGTRVLQVPASLAYGDKGVCFENGECLVQPGERLQFELTLKRVAMPPATTRDF